MRRSEELNKKREAEHRETIAAMRRRIEELEGWKQYSIYYIYLFVVFGLWIFYTNGEVKKSDPPLRIALSRSQLLGHPKKAELATKNSHIKQNLVGVAPVYFQSYEVSYQWYDISLFVEILSSRFSTTFRITQNVVNNVWTRKRFLSISLNITCKEVKLLISQVVSIHFLRSIFICASNKEVFNWINVQECMNFNFLIQCF